MRFRKDREFPPLVRIILIIVDIVIVALLIIGLHKRTTSDATEQLHSMIALLKRTTMQPRSMTAPSPPSQSQIACVFTSATPTHSPLNAKLMTAISVKLL
jgi:hypothetical protein